MAPARAYQAVLDKDTIRHTRNLLYSPIRKPQKVQFNKYMKIIYNTEMPGTTSHIKCTYEERYSLGCNMAISHVVFKLWKGNFGFL